MRIHVDAHTIGAERTVTVMLTGTDDDFVDLIDSAAAARVNGALANVAAKIAQQTGLVAERTDDRAQAVRHLQRAIEILERAE